MHMHVSSPKTKSDQVPSESWRDREKRKRDVFWFTIHDSCSGLVLLVFSYLLLPCTLCGDRTTRIPKPWPCDRRQHTKQRLCKLTGIGDHETCLFLYDHFRSSDQSFSRVSVKWSENSAHTSLLKFNTSNRTKRLWLCWLTIQSHHVTVPSANFDFLL